MIVQEITRGLARDVTRDIAYIPPSTGGLTPVWSVDFTAGLPGGLTFSRASGGNYFNASGVLTAASSNVARLDYHPSTLTPRGILVEDARTNYLLNSASPATQTVSLSTGTYSLWLVGSGSCAAAAGTAAGSGFGTATAASSVTFTVSTAGTVVFTVSGTVTRFQCENGAFATSFITTTGAAATRAADVASFDAMPSYNLTEGTVVLEYELMVVSGSTQKAMTLQLNSSENDLLTLNIGAAGAATYSVKSGNASVAGISVGTVSAGSVVKTALAYKLDDFAGCVNGGSVGTDTAGAAPATTLNRMCVGMRGNSTQFLYGWVRKMAYYNTRLGNSTLQQLTT